MIEAGEDELICDFAETYHVCNYRSMNPTLAATLAAGLGNNSRIKLKMSGLRCDIDTMLMAMAVDRLSYLLWAKTKDGQHNRNKPESIYELLVRNDSRETEVEGFNSSEEFESEWNRRIMEAEYG